MEAGVAPWRLLRLQARVVEEGTGEATRMHRRRLRRLVVGEDAGVAVAILVETETTIDLTDVFLHLDEGNPPHHAVAAGVIEEDEEGVVVEETGVVPVLAHVLLLEGETDMTDFV